MREKNLARSLAKKIGAKFTLRAISNNGCSREILTTLYLEVPEKVFIEFVFSGGPSWARNTLRHIPDLDAHRTALIERAAEKPLEAFRVLAWLEDNLTPQETKFLELRC